jgi:hypothetical protein
LPSNNDNPLIEKVVVALRTALNDVLGPDATDAQQLKQAASEVQEAIDALDSVGQFVSDAASTVSNAIYDLENLDLSEISQPLDKASQLLSDTDPS